MDPVGEPPQSQPLTWLTLWRPLHRVHVFGVRNVIVQNKKRYFYVDVAEAPPQRQQLAQSTPWRPVQRVRMLTTRYTYKNNDSPTTSTQTFQLLGWAFQTPKVSSQPILVQNAYLIHLTLEIGKLFNAISTKSWIRLLIFPIECKV